MAISDKLWYGVLLKGGRSNESTPGETEITAEKETRPVPPAELASVIASTSSASPKASAQSPPDPKPGTIALIDGVKSMWIPGFGWVKDEGVGSVSIPVGSEGDINKQVGVMGGGTTVGNPGDELTGNKVGIMGGGSAAEDMYESGHVMGQHNFINNDRPVIINQPLSYPAFAYLSQAEAGSVLAHSHHL